ncbi:MAG: thioredoxin family protein [Agriterribacter sp.]
MKKIIFIFSVVLLSAHIHAQGKDESKQKNLLYHPEENAAAGIAEAVKKAKQEKKQVLIQAGGNWCGWCLEFNRFVHADPPIDSLLKANYIVYHLNYSKENKNEPIFEQYHFPQRFGFPVFLILNSEGQLIHTQNSAYLEEGKTYDRKKVLDFLNDWNLKALDADTYRKQ